MDYPWHVTPKIVRAVLFDLDDTLCDTIGTRPQRARKALEWLCARQPHLPLEELVSAALEPLGEPRSVRGLGRVLHDLGLEHTPEAAEVLRIFDGHHDPIQRFPTVKETVVRLHERYVLGVISNAEGWCQRRKLAHLGLEPYVACLVVSGDVGCEKPDPRIFRRALELIGVAPDEAVFVGDRLDVDVAGAKAAGMRAIWFNHWGGTLPEHGPPPDSIIRQFGELLPLLQVTGPAE
jgi:HAD superfamily hydrolase (TIGR01549 family)